jgi:hypothetical protein
VNFAWNPRINDGIAASQPSRHGLGGFSTLSLCGRVKASGKWNYSG